MTALNFLQSGRMQLLQYPETCVTQWVLANKPAPATSWPPAIHFDQAVLCSDSLNNAYQPGFHFFGQFPEAGLVHQPDDR